MKRIVIALLFVSILSCCAWGEITSGPGIAVAETPQGKIQGYIRDGIYTYHGIAYAQAERFMPPQKLPHWDGVKMAVVYGNVSPQPASPEDDMFPSHKFWPHWEVRYNPQGDNCQNLNIWTPSLDGKKRPVMVWIHGGGFQVGSSYADFVYDGENLSRNEDVVVVSVSHRLNVVGFLDLSAYGEKYKYSGNLGMMDIVYALEWVKDNIASFGGDPDNVTLFGQSGGGAKILTLMAMPAAKGLFHKAIVQSGAVNMMGITLPTPAMSRRVAELTLENLGVDAEGLKNVPYNELHLASKKALALTAQENGLRALSWAPVADGEYIPANPVADAFKGGDANIPLMIGTALNEWISIPLFADMARVQSDNKNTWTQEQTRAKLNERFGDKAEAVSQAFMKAYPHKKPGDVLYVDSWLRDGTIRTANVRADMKAGKVYCYVFTWETPVMGGYGMAYHCSELPFVFNNIALSETATGGGEKAQNLAHTISHMWAEFARTGNPSSEWPAYTPENGAVMILDDESFVGYHHDDELMRLLNGR